MLTAATPDIAQNASRFMNYGLVCWHLQRARWTRRCTCKRPFTQPITGNRKKAVRKPLRRHDGSIILPCSLGTAIEHLGDFTSDEDLRSHVATTRSKLHKKMEDRHIRSEKGASATSDVTDDEEAGDSISTPHRHTKECDDELLSRHLPPWNSAIDRLSRTYSTVSARYERFVSPPWSLAYSETPIATPLQPLSLRYSFTLPHFSHCTIIGRCVSSLRCAQLYSLDLQASGDELLVTARYLPTRDLLTTHIDEWKLDVEPALTDRLFAANHSCSSVIKVILLQQVGTSMTLHELALKPGEAAVEKHTAGFDGIAGSVYDVVMAGDDMKSCILVCECCTEENVSYLRQWTGLTWVCYVLSTNSFKPIAIRNLDSAVHVLGICGIEMQVVVLSPSSNSATIAHRLDLKSPVDCWYIIDAYLLLSTDNVLHMCQWIGADVSVVASVALRVPITAVSCTTWLICVGQSDGHVLLLSWELKPLQDIAPSHTSGVAIASVNVIDDVLSVIDVLGRVSIYCVEAIGATVHRTDILLTDAARYETKF